MTVATNVRGMRARTAQQIVSAQGPLFVATMIRSAGKNVQAQVHVAATKSKHFVKKGREIVIKIGNVKAH